MAERDPLALPPAPSRVDNQILPIYRLAGDALVNDLFDQRFSFDRRQHPPAYAESFGCAQSSQPYQWTA